MQNDGTQLIVVERMYKGILLFLIFIVLDIVFQRVKHVMNTDLLIEIIDSPNRQTNRWKKPLDFTFEYKKKHERHIILLYTPSYDSTGSTALLFFSSQCPCSHVASKSIHN